MTKHVERFAARTTAGEVFTGQQTRELARLVFLRFGRDLPAATAAWRRLLENSCDENGLSEILGFDREEMRP
jgi:hypothetical protein